MENKNLNEVKDLNENEFEKVSGGMNKNTKSVKLRDDEVIPDGGWGGLPEHDCICTKCGNRFTLQFICLSKLKCSKCGGICRPCRTDE